MARRFCVLAMAAGLLSSAAALSSHDIPSDLSLKEILSSAQTYLAKGETSEALVYYDAAIALEPTNYLTLFKRGATYLSLGRTNQATEDFNKVLGINPNFEGAHVQLAKIKSKAGDWDAARSSYISAKKSRTRLRLSNWTRHRVLHDWLRKPSGLGSGRTVSTMPASQFSSRPGYRRSGR